MVGEPFRSIQKVVFSLGSSDPYFASTWLCLSSASRVLISLISWREVVWVLLDFSLELVFQTYPVTEFMADAAMF